MELLELVESTELELVVRFAEVELQLIGLESKSSHWASVHLQNMRTLDSNVFRQSRVLPLLPFRSKVRKFKLTHSTRIFILRMQHFFRGSRD